jgi:hypothetical protein
MRAITISVLLCLFASPAVATQNEDATQAPSRHHAATTGMAPVGHRQPTQRGLPPAVRRQENRRSAPDPFGPLPKICSNC